MRTPAPGENGEPFPTRPVPSSLDQTGAQGATKKLAEDTFFNLISVGLPINFHRYQRTWSKSFDGRL